MSPHPLVVRDVSPQPRIGHGFTWSTFEPFELDVAWRDAIVGLRKCRAFTAIVKTDTRELDESVIEPELPRDGRPLSPCAV